jgi:hypothetical protein
VGADAFGGAYIDRDDPGPFVLLQQRPAVDQYDGESVSLTPSIGNWSLPCRSAAPSGVRGEAVKAAGRPEGAPAAAVGHGAAEVTAP